MPLNHKYTFLLWKNDGLIYEIRIA